MIESVKAASCRTLVVDDHPVVRKGLIQLLAINSGLEICGEASGVQEAMEMIRTKHPELVILDLALKDGNGLELIKRALAEYPKVKILVSSMQEDWLFAERVIRAGALGYVNKQEAPEKLIEAVRIVLSGKVYLNEEVKNSLVNRIVRPHSPASNSPLEQLSDRELEVFGLLGEGKSTRDIADALHISIKTIETYRQNIKTKLNLKGSSELIQRAVEWAITLKLNLSHNENEFEGQDPLDMKYWKIDPAPLNNSPDTTC